MVILLMSQWTVNESAEAATIAEDKISWMNTSATVQKHYSPGPTSSVSGATSTASFWLRDSALDTTKTASTTWYFNNNMGSDIGIDSQFTLYSASTTGNINSSTTCYAIGSGISCGGMQEGGTAASSTGATFSTSNTASTSLSAISVVSSATGTTNTFSELVGWNKDNPVFKNKSAINASSTVVATYTYNIVDSYASSSAGSWTGNKIVKVTSSSDTEGEWVDITQVTAPGSLSTDDEADYYNGSVILSKDAGSTTAGDDAVWVQDGDTLTVSYYGCGTSCTDTTDSSTIISSTTATIDFAAPTITVASPLDGTITKDTTPEFTFTVADSASGFTATAPLTYVSAYVNMCKATTTEFSYANLGSKSMTITVALTPGTNWTTANTGTCNDGGSDRTGGGFNVDGTTVTTTTTGTWHGSSTNYKIIVSDIAGNQKKIDGAAANFTIDAQAPNMTSAITGKKYDADKDTQAPYTLTGNDANDNFSIKVVFDESLDAASVETTDFTVDGVTPDTVTVAGKDEFTDRLVYLGMANELAHNSKPVIKLTGAVTDRVGNSLNDKPSGVTSGTDNSGSATDGIADKVTATDGVKPTISGASLTTDLIKKSGSAVLTFNSDENMKDNSNTIAEVCTCGVVLGGGSAGTASSTKLAVSLTSPTAGKATFKQATFSATGIYGIVINGKDVNNNVGNSGGTKITSEDVSSQFTTTTAAGANAIKLKKWPLADHDGDGTLHDGVSVTINGVAETVTMSGNAIDWSENETLTMTFSSQVLATDTVKVTYYYVADAQVVEVDISKPTVSSFSPADGSSSQNRRPMIGVTWDEDEYAGDTYTTVTLTKAELKDPAGTKTDVLANMSTSDNKNFFYRPTEDLAYGDFTLTVSAKDAAGNEQVNKVGRFTVKQRALTKVSLLPGWNLISLPGTPTNTAINTVMASTPKAETILTYDPTVAGGWLSAVRDSSGTLSGTLGAIDAARAYWVYTTNNDPIKVDIPGYEGGAQQLPPAISLVKGWNMVPAVSITGSAIGATLDSDTYFTGLSWTRAYGFNTTTDVYSSFIPTTAADTSVVIGKGYWLFLSKAGTLVP